ncbi:hypothetical protein U1E44_02145 [Arenibacter sp. GZD96]|uniref:hypothetical protein n=1 Tax=Aurantibrevibacter litoralis TaxID=3106030 RepID=UPI002AFEBBD3|nr:hypothetical protein [Arenibacter sp. GZD-96]MEA1784880.1 hypothetical protein [Arenibacter sp. GZD-96]
MKRNILILLLIISSNLFAQKERLYFLDWQLRKGDFNALTEIAEFFNSKTDLTEYLGYHIINTNESTVSKRIVQENTMFLYSEIVIDSTTTTADFKKFLTDNQQKIKFSNLANAFLITDFDKRTTDFEIVDLTDFKWSELNAKRNELLSLDWVKENKIDSLIKAKNSLALLETASVLLKDRNRFDEYDYNEEEVVNLIQLLTKSEIAVPNERGELSYHLEKEFYDEPKINLLIFFANNYKSYKWNESIRAFSNKNLDRKTVDYESQLFEMLSSENDTIAQNAYISLTKLDPTRVSELSDQYRKADISENYILPQFSFRFLKQLVQLTNYSKENNIDFEGNEKLKNQIELLKTNLTFSKRRKLEDQLINELTLVNITAFEYWSLIYQKSWSLTYSAGRILDKFYSNNWNNLINNPKHLKTYLLKSRLFDDLGIIGFCNNYLVKFLGSSQETKTSIEKLSSTNLKIQHQIDKALEIANKQIEFKEKEKKTWNGNTFDRIDDFDKSFTKLEKFSDSLDVFEDEIELLLSKIKYSQIEKAIKTVEKLPFKDFIKYTFLDRDFGFSFIGDFKESEVRKEFLANYEKFNELELYKYYLQDAGIDFTDSNSNLDFDKIYEILKYDINSAFAGGGGSTKDNGVYAVIKVLEITFNETLGFPNKLCSSNGMYACNSRSRAKEWMNYLEINNHLKKEYNEPVSFAYE